MFKNVVNVINVGLKNHNLVSKRLIYLNSINNYPKNIEISEDKAKKTITIQGKYMDDVTANNGIKPNYLKYEHDHESACSFCKLEKSNIYVQHTDVLVLRQFLKEDGSLLPQKVTGLCWKQYKKLRVLAKHAHAAGLLMNLQPLLIDGSKPSAIAEKRPADLKWNRIYDDYEYLKRTKKYL